MAANIQEWFEEGNVFPTVAEGVAASKAWDAAIKSVEAERTSTQQLKREIAAVLKRNLDKNGSVRLGCLAMFITELRQLSRD